MSDKLRIAWMVDRFYPGDGFCQFGIMEPNKLGEFLLCIRGAGNENRARICERFGDGLEIVMIHRDMPAADGICLVMDVLGRMIWMQNESFYFSRIEVKHARFAVINPNDRVIVMLCHEMGLSCQSMGCFLASVNVAILKGNESCARSIRIIITRLIMEKAVVS
jgi:hypothetical protein